MPQRKPQVRAQFWPVRNVQGRSVNGRRVYQDTAVQRRRAQASDQVPVGLLASEQYTRRVGVNRAATLVTYLPAISLPVRIASQLGHTEEQSHVQWRPSYPGSAGLGTVGHSCYRSRLLSQ